MRWTRPVFAATTVSTICLLWGDLPACFAFCERSFLLDPLFMAWWLLFRLRPRLRTRGWLRWPDQARPVGTSQMRSRFLQLPISLMFLTWLLLLKLRLQLRLCLGLYPVVWQAR